MLNNNGDGNDCLWPPDGWLLTGLHRLIYKTDTRWRMELSCRWIKCFFWPFCALFTLKAKVDLFHFPLCNSLQVTFILQIKGYEWLTLNIFALAHLHSCEWTRLHSSRQWYLSERDQIRRNAATWATFVRVRAYFWTCSKNTVTVHSTNGNTWAPAWHLNAVQYPA